MTRTFSDGHSKVLPAYNFLSQYYFYNIFLQKSCRFSLQTLTKFEAAKTGSGVGFLRLTAVWALPWDVISFQKLFCICYFTKDFTFERTLLAKTEGPLYQVLKIFRVQA